MATRNVQLSIQVIFLSALFFSILKLKNQSAPTQFHDMFPSKCSTRAPFRALSWAVFYPLAVFSFNCFSFSTRFGHIKFITCLASCCSVSFSFCVSSKKFKGLYWIRTLKFLRLQIYFCSCQNYGIHSAQKKKLEKINKIFQSLSF